MILFNFLVLLISIFLVSNLRRFNSNYPAILSYWSTISISLVGLLAPFIWNWSRLYAPPGLLPSRLLSENDISLLHYLFLLMSFGSLLAGFLFNSLIKRSDYFYKSGESHGAADGIRNSILVPVIGFTALFFLIVGLGGSIWESQSYLDFSGSQTFLRAGNALLPAVIIALGFSMKNSSFQRINTFLFSLLFLIQAGRGSRVIFIFPLAVLALFVKDLRKWWTKFLFIGVILYLIQVLTSITFISRSSKGGLLHLFEVAALGVSQNGNLPKITNTFGSLCASLTSWAPTVVSSVDEPSRTIILKNLNPLIGVGSDSFAYSSDGIERLHPFIWIPLSSLGQIYGAFGGFILFLIIFLITVIAGLSLLQTNNGKSLSVFSLLSISTYIFQFPLLLQYSSRIWFRVIWFMLIVSLLHLFVSFNGRYRKGLSKELRLDD